MSPPEPSCVMITGASRGLGAALALEYARAGRTLALTGRDRDALAGTARACEQRGARVLSHVADIIENDSLVAWVAEVHRSHTIDLLIANAGYFGGRRENEELERLDTAVLSLRTNLEGTIRSVDPVLRHMLARGRGHIAVISSLAARQPLADAPSYSASKAGLTAYCAALDEAVAPLGVLVSVIMAGHIDTDQTRRHVGKLPGLASPDAAASYIRHRLDRRDRSIVFPLGLALLIGVGRWSPRRLRHYFSRPFRFHVKDQ